jgi:hypothetical protein
MTAMQTDRSADRSNTPPPPPGSFSPFALVLMLAISPLVGLVWGWAADAVQFQLDRSPFLVFPIIVGVFAGLTIVGLARFTQIGHRPTLLFAVVFAAATAAFGQHYLHYMAQYSQPLPQSSSAKGTDDAATALAQALIREEAAGGSSALHKELTPSFFRYMLAQARRGRPLPGGYLATGWGAWLTWSIDLLLTVAAAVVVAAPALRIPYCNRCRSWYRTVRNGRIDVATARRLAEICSADDVEGLRSPRYRLSCCQGGCGPTRCELSWEEPSGTVDLVRVWLDADQRRQVAAVLDGLAEEENQ